MFTEVNAEKPGNSGVGAHLGRPPVYSFTELLGHRRAFARGSPPEVMGGVGGRTRRLAYKSDTPRWRALIWRGLGPIQFETLTHQRRGYHSNGPAVGHSKAVAGLFDHMAPTWPWPVMAVSEALCASDANVMVRARLRPIADCSRVHPHPSGREIQPILGGVVTVHQTQFPLDPESAGGRRSPALGFCFLSTGQAVAISNGVVDKCIHNPAGEILLPAYHQADRRGRHDIADQLDMLVDDVADILARTHPLAPILRKWAERASAPPTTCPSTRIWLERTNA